MTDPDSSPPRLAVFDCDGTLVDSQHNIVAAAAAAWREYGLEPPPPAQIRLGIGLPLGEAVARLRPGGGPAEIESLCILYKQAFQAQRRQPDHVEPLYPGALQALEELAVSGTLLGVATGKSRRGLLSTLGRHGLLDSFVVLKTADDAPGKPNPHMLLDAMAETGARPETTVMIGDTVFDMAMARNARVRAVGVSWGYHERAELATAGAHAVIDSFGDLSTTIASLLGDK
ncbi:MAG: HAD-IA family hydrolase [Alphaproteobacteria bacterium]